MHKGTDHSQDMGDGHLDMGHGSMSLLWSTLLAKIFSCIERVNRVQVFLIDLSNRIPSLV